MKTTTKGKRKGKAMQPTRTLEQVALDEFAATGETSGLGALADWVDEFQPERGEFSAQLREAMGDTFKADGVRFFYRNAGYGLCANETEQAARWRVGYELREAEEWLSDHDFGYPTDAVDAVRIVWELDTDYDSDNYDAPDMPEIAWGCMVQMFDGKRWNTVESMWGITFGGDGYPDGDPYKRVVEAELALEAM